MLSVVSVRRWRFAGRQIGANGNATANPIAELMARATHLGWPIILGLKLTHEAGGEWFEYDVGDTTFAISAADAEHPVPVRGAVLVFEVSDLDAEVARLQKCGATFRRGITETSARCQNLSAISLRCWLLL